MFVVWRRKPITSDRRAELFSTFSCGRKWTGATLYDAPVWTPLYCEHRGPGRVAMTALLVKSIRQEGRPRQEMLHRFHCIRTCCLASPLMVGAWWHSVEDSVRFWGVYDNGPVSRLIARDERAVLEALRAVVPPSRKGAAEFRAYRVGKEQERWKAEVLAGAPWYAVLGVSAFECTPELAAKKYRELAMPHHPDRGGDPLLFGKIAEAYDRAKVACAASKEERYRGVGPAMFGGK